MALPVNKHDNDNFFKTEISHSSTDQNNVNTKSKGLPTEKESEQINHHNQDLRQKTPEKYKPEIGLVHMRRTPTPSEGTRKPPLNEQPDGHFFKFMNMRKIAKQVRKVQINRQRRLDYTGNETIEHKVRKFKPEDIEPIIYGFLKDNLEFCTYDSEECKHLSMELSEELKDVVKAMKFPRYKFVTMVTIGQKNKQCVSIGSRSIWDKDMDTYASVHYSNESIFAVAIVFATFFE
ncbi:dynein light chain Tctex-type protein 2B-like [Mytilus trossulus]|uniref:dynein light chain Tctex-type protein 2B-like n=1 Tax=Mytilus trossulus TaxID=6551 RepID=UPI0030074148